MEISLETASGTRKDFILPDSWDEVKADVWIHILEFRSACMARELPSDQWVNPFTPAHELVVVHYIAARKALSKLVPAMTEYLAPEVVEACAANMAWLARFPDHYKSMRPRFALIFIGPKNQLKNWTWMRYALGDEMLRAYTNAVTSENTAAQDKALRYLFAVLYAPFGLWNSRIADVTAFIARFIPLKWKLEALSNYNGLRNWLSGVYPRFFNGGSGEESFGDVMRRLTVAMAGAAFGDVDGVKRANIHDVCVYQEMKAEEMQQMEEAKAKSASS